MRLRINWAGGFLLAGAVIVLIAVVFVLQSGDKQEARLRAEEAQIHRIIDVAIDTLSSLKDLETGQRGFLITGDPKYLKPFVSGKTRLVDEFAELRSITAGQPEAAALVSAFEDSARAKMAELQSTVVLRAAGQQGLALARVFQGEGMIQMDKARAEQTEILKLERARLLVKQRQLDTAERATHSRVLTGCAFLFLLLVVGTALLAKELSRETELAQSLERSESLYKQLAGNLEQEVNSRTEELLQVNRELEAFSFSVSHDLRAPLRSIDGYSHIILEDYWDRFDENGRTLLLRIRSATARMGDLITSLLELSRVGRQDLRRDPVSLTSLATASLAALAALDPHRRVHLNIAPDLMAEGDPDLLRIVFDNLLSNAWKFTSKEENPSIEVGYLPADENGRCAFFIRDNGVGFDPSYSDRLYTPFQRLHSDADFDGVGIGLATVKRVIHRHGGDLWAESEPSKGATFFFTLP